LVKDIIGKIVTMLPKSVGEKVARFMLKNFILNKANIKVEGIDTAKNVSGPIIFICNHLSNADGPVLSGVLEPYDPTFVAGVKLSQNNFTKLGILAVKTTPIKPDTADKVGLSNIVSIAKKGGNIVIFPEGTRSRNGKMIKAKKGLYLIAKLTKATIVPIGMWGTEKFMPINDNGMEKEKVNRTDIHIKIGEPFTLRPRAAEEDKKQYEEAVVEEAMTKIAELLPEEYRGEYSI